MMRAVLLNQPGKPETMVISELPVPVPGPEEIRIRIQAASLNPVDYKVAANGHPAWNYPHVPGVDAAGIVDKIGEGVSKWSVGDRVVVHGDLAKPGMFAEYSINSAHTCAAIPEGLTFAEAAAFPCAGLTAYQALDRKMNIRKGGSILIHAGAGGVGGYAIQLAKAFGASRIMTTASTEHFEYVKSLGADEAIDYRTEDVHERVMHFTSGVGANFILNSINRITAQEDLNRLAFGGQLACIAGAPENVADFQPSSKTFTVHKLMLGGAIGSGNRREEEDLPRMADEFMQLMLDKKVNAMITERICLDQVPEGLSRLAGRHVRGKIIVEL